jgi:hypothetical protein
MKMRLGFLLVTVNTMKVTLNVGLPKVEYLLKNNPPLVAIELSVSC